MAKQTINIGASPNDGTGTPLRTAFDYTNQNFTELYTATGPSGNNIVVPGNATITGDLTAARLNVTGATIPANGVYLGSSNNLTFSFNSTLGMSLNAGGLLVNNTSGFNTVANIKLKLGGRFLSGISGVGAYSFGTADAGGFVINDAGDGSTEVLLLTLNSTANVVLKGGTVGANGVGVTFPATQVASSDANCLDDYEEGTWTIGLTFGGASTGITANASVGRYTKIGRQVTVSGLLSLTSKGSSTGIAEITGLPFTIANANEAYSVANVRFNGVSFADVPICVGATNSTKISLQEITNAGAVTDITDADFTNTSSCIIGFTYTV